MNQNSAITIASRGLPPGAIDKLKSLGFGGSGNVAWLQAPKRCANEGTPEPTRAHVKEHSPLLRTSKGTQFSPCFFPRLALRSYWANR